MPNKCLINAPYMDDRHPLSPPKNPPPKKSPSHQWVPVSEPTLKTSLKNIADAADGCVVLRRG